VERSADWLRGAVWMAHCLGDSGEEEYYRRLLAEAEAREASVPTAADVIAAAAEALEMYQWHMKHCNTTYLGFNYTEERKEQMAAREYVMSNAPTSALAAIAKWKEAQRG